MAARDFLGVQAQRGKIVRDRVPIAHFPDGTPIALPVIIVGGKHDGPAMYLQAGLHGDEVTGIEILRRAVASLDPARMRGTVVAVPIANLPSYLSKSRGFSLEERGPIDMNRIFPGSKHGLLSERIAHLLFHEFLLKADYTIDFHCALAGGNIVPFVYIDPADDENGTLEARVRMGRAFGTDLAYYKARGSKLGTSVVTGSLSAQADLHKKPALPAEMGESLRITWEFVDIGVRGTLNVLRELGILEGARPTPKEQRKFSKILLAHSEAGGLLHPKVRLGQEVEEGAVIAEVVDPVTSKAAPVTAPGSGIVLRLLYLSPIYPGAEIAWVVQ